MDNPWLFDTIESLALKAFIAGDEELTESLLRDLTVNELVQLSNQLEAFREVVLLTRNSKFPAAAYKENSQGTCYPTPPAVG